LVAPDEHEIAVGVAFARHVRRRAMQGERLREVGERLLTLPQRVIDEADVVERRSFAAPVADAALDVERLCEIAERLRLIARVD
jgi:hypothetical protein